MTLDLRKLVRERGWVDIRIKGQRRLTLRLHLATFLMSLAVRVLGVGNIDIHVEVRDR